MYDWVCEEGDVSIGTIRMLRLAKFAAMTALVAIASGIPVQAASWFEKNFYLSGPRYDAVLPPCDAALGTIQSRFATKEGRFWNSDLQLVDFDRVRQISFRPWAENTIPQRFCTARALTSDGRRRTVH